MKISDRVMGTCVLGGCMFARGKGKFFCFSFLLKFNFNSSHLLNRKGFIFKATKSFLKLFSKFVLFLGRKMFIFKSKQLTSECLNYNISLRLFESFLLSFLRELPNFNLLYTFYTLVNLNQKLLRNELFLFRTRALGGGEENAESLHPDVARPPVGSFGQKRFEQK